MDDTIVLTRASKKKKMSKTPTADIKRDLAALHSKKRIAAAVKQVAEERVALFHAAAVIVDG